MHVFYVNILQLECLVYTGTMKRLWIENFRVLKCLPFWGFLLIKCYICVGICDIRMRGVGLQDKIHNFPILIVCPSPTKHVKNGGL